MVVLGAGACGDGRLSVARSGDHHLGLTRRFAEGPWRVEVTTVIEAGPRWAHCRRRWRRSCVPPSAELDPETAAKRQPAERAFVWLRHRSEVGEGSGSQNGAYPVGSLLPAEARFAKEFGCSRSTFVSVLEILSCNGWTQAQPGRGRFVLARRAAEPGRRGDDLARTRRGGRRGLTHSWIRHCVTPGSGHARPWGRNGCPCPANTRVR